MTDYLTLIEVLAIHQDQIEIYGGSDGIRDLGLLEAALYRPQSGYYEDVIAQAAALWESISQSHPFVDGNKRTGFAAVYTFLSINGLMITADVEDVIAFLEPHYDNNTIAFETLEDWLRRNTRENRAG